ncbi:MAG: CarD family transcriptional regulator [Ruminococcus sp.]
MEYPIHSVVMHITTGVCRIQDIQEKQFTEDQHQKYYVLQPILKKAQHYSFRLKMTLFDSTIVDKRSHYRTVA